MSTRKAATIEDDLRRLARRAWDAQKVDLAIELEATAYRCFGLDLNAEREAKLSAAGCGLERYSTNQTKTARDAGGARTANSVTSRWVS